MTMHFPSPLENLYHWEKEKADQVYLKEPVKGDYKELTWKQTGSEVRKLAGYLRSLNLPEKNKITILSKNCSHWIITDLAVMMAGHIAVPLYPNLNPDTLGQIIRHCDARVIFIGKLDNFKQMEPGIPSGLTCISFPYYPREMHLQWDDLISD